ncbi:MAG: alpha-amylase family glycosyl hydrolase [Bacteroidetes bacterium]|nr:alpha-amylase family glycosyl hydrolase [Rhodothermia bacterium]MCS7154304.1 alpha-amylase family glycosyl hydrolase [Bacteroidota bacterium]MCX7906660.1 alpha-amylase family glycosyl hydrolase [Bacteroidota bacterium]MDW8137060.1 alpha-amylase family glycosyl hydrolase [Bacteroidota bacterium]MDW8285069.1 alpha-amylase family glycosyl hydrolase [Bacteroidota bacterium]
MMPRETDHPNTLEVHARVWLRQWRLRTGKPELTLADLPEEALEEVAERSFDLLWLMGVWELSPGARTIARRLAQQSPEYRRLLPDLKPEDVEASPYAVGAYRVAADLGGEEALRRLRRRLERRGVRLLLDFVPNHTALDHPWVWEHPEYYVGAPANAAVPDPAQSFEAETRLGPWRFAYGRDPHFPAWIDTAQLNVFYPATRQALLATLRKIARLCDGVRCDMAMLLLNDVFERTWRPWLGPQARPESEFWPEAIFEIRREHPDFLFLAEVYWDLEYRLQQLGFDYTYDKRFYDRVLWSTGEMIRAHLVADWDYQVRCVRFLENHDEARVAGRLPPAQHRAAAVLLATIPGMRLWYQGQREGRRLRAPVQLVRWPEEPTDLAMATWYDQLLALQRHPALRQGWWRLLVPERALEGEEAYRNVIAYRWDAGRQGRLLVTVNYQARRALARVRLDVLGVSGRTVKLRDRLSGKELIGPGSEWFEEGIVLELEPYEANVWEIL